MHSIYPVNWDVEHVIIQINTVCYCQSRVHPCVMVGGNSLQMWRLADH
jgi:hypothetical protein